MSTDTITRPQADHDADPATTSAPGEGVSIRPVDIDRDTANLHAWLSHPRAHYWQMTELDETGEPLWRDREVLDVDTLLGEHAQHLGHHDVADDLRTLGPCLGKRGDGRLEVQADARILGKTGEPGAGARHQRLIGGDDVLSGHQRLLDRRFRGIALAADQLDKDIDVAIGRHGHRVVKPAVARKVVAAANLVA